MFQIFEKTLSRKITSIPLKQGKGNAEENTDKYVEKEKKIIFYL
jgi:hypothetical protein